MMPISRRINGATLIAASLCCLCSISLTETSQAQIIFRRGQATFGGREIRPETATAKLPNDPELESTLEKAERFLADGNFRVATNLMQSVLERSADSLYSVDDQTYFSFVRRVEKQFAALPAEGLAAYRLDADAEAMALVSSGERGGLQNALSLAVGKYFNSSIGDDAAFRLGRLYLDQYDFVTARRVFEKTLTHPDLSISKDEILAHVALCDLFLNDLKSAQQASEQLAESAPDLRIAKLVADEIDSIQSGRDNLNSAQWNPAANWKMPLGSQLRYGVGLPVNQRMLGDKLVAAFQYYFDPSPRILKSYSTSGGFLAGVETFSTEVTDTQSAIEKKMLAKRKEHHWRPTGMLLFGPNEVYVKTAHDMVALNKSELPIETQESLGGDIEVGDSMISWQSMWKNIFEIDEGTFIRSGNVLRYGNVVPSNQRAAAAKLKNQTPVSKPEVQIYGDAIAAQFSIHDGVLYSIEGKPSNGRSRTRRRFFASKNLIRSRQNFLVAYDSADDGKELWRLPRQASQTEKVAEDLDEDGKMKPSRFLEHGGFMGAPVGFQNSIIAPVNQNGAIWIFAFDPNDNGATLWKTHLCDEPTTGANAWSAINLSVDGEDVLASCGLGIVFVLDASTGQIRIARRYERGGKPDSVLGDASWPGEKKYNYNQGWSSDTIIPFGRQMVCFCSDGKAIESIDRETGKTLWKSDFDSVSKKLDYLLGVYDGVLYAAGPETIAAFDLKTQQLIWGGDEMFDGKVSLGKGILTPQGIFVPVENEILQYELNAEKLATSPNPVRAIAVDLGGDELGNLFSDGERFWVHGGNRIYALEAKSQ